MRLFKKIFKFLHKIFNFKKDVSDKKTSSDDEPDNIYPMW